MWLYDSGAGPKSLTGFTLDATGEPWRSILGAIGDIPVAGVVRVMVDESDYTQARAVVER